MNRIHWNPRRSLLRRVQSAFGEFSLVVHGCALVPLNDIVHVCYYVLDSFGTITSSSALQGRTPTFERQEISDMKRPRRDWGRAPAFVLRLTEARQQEVLVYLAFWGFFSNSQFFFLLPLSELFLLTCLPSSALAFTLVWHLSAITAIHLDVVVGQSWCGALDTGENQWVESNT